MSYRNTHITELVFKDKSTMSVFSYEIDHSQFEPFGFLIFRGVDSSIAVNMREVLYAEKRAINHDTDEAR